MIIRSTSKLARAGPGQNVAYGTAWVLTERGCECMRLSSNEDIEAAAADFLAHMDRQDGPDRADSQFQAWCRADRRNLAAYLRLLEVWNRLDALDREPSIGQHARAAAAAREPQAKDADR